MRIGIEGLPLMFHRTGTSTYTHELVQNLRRLDQGDVVMLFGRNQAESGISYHSISRRERAANLLYKEYRLPLELAKQEVDIYHSPRDMGLPRPSRLRCPSIITVHDIILVRMASRYYGQARARLYQRRLLSRVRGADHIITASEFSRQDLLAWSGIDAGKISVVHNGVSDIFHPVSDEALLQGARDRYQLPPRFILCIGSTEPRKNVRRAIEAYHQLRRARTDISLVITGVDYCRRGPEDAFAGLDLEGVHFAGYIADPDMAPVYNLASLLLFPSLYEGFGLPPLEAMACHTPVITSNATSIPEVVGDAALLIDPLDVAGIAGALDMVLSSSELRDDLVNKGALRASRYSWRRSAEATRKVYQHVISQSGH